MNFNFITAKQTPDLSMTTCYLVIRKKESVENQITQKNYKFYAYGQSWKIAIWIVATLSLFDKKMQQHCA